MTTKNSSGGVNWPTTKPVHNPGTQDLPKDASGTPAPSRVPAPPLDTTPQRYLWATAALAGTAYLALLLYVLKGH